MHTIQNDKATVIVYGNIPLDNELQQIKDMLECPAFTGAHIRIMPDHHAGSGCVIGFTCPVDMNDPKVVPNVVGVDIGCGVLGIQLPEDRVPLDRKEHLAAFDAHMRATVPFGLRDRAVQHPDLGDICDAHVMEWAVFQAAFSQLITKVGINPTKAYCSIGSLGSGNHFVEIGREFSPEGVAGDCHWLTIHSGSRNFGLQVALYHQKKAQAQHPESRKDLAWLEGPAALEYLEDMRTAQHFADLNRWIMAYELMGAWKIRLHEKRECTYVLSVHNYIDGAGMIRKGAIAAHTGQGLLVPWNMRDGLIRGVGKGNPEWNYSAPHGAGRLMSRGDAKRTLDMATFKQQMEGIWTSCVSKATLDEAPGAYKSSTEVAGAIADTVEIQATVRPIYNFKAGE